MESLLGFKETTTSGDVVVGDKLCGYKLVPWISWDDWSFVRESLFSSSPESIASALRRILAWRSRGCVPVVIEVTASIVEIQQKDPFFRDDASDNALHSEEMLAMLYCMAIMRLVNGIVEKTRKRTEISIAEAADAIGIPRMLIDVRHEGSHRDLPSLRLVRLASIKALDWLKSYYWEPQTKKIPFPRDGTCNLRNEVKSRLHELALCLKVNQTTRLSSSTVKGKLSKKQVSKMLKNFLRLYSSFSREVVSEILEFLLKALDSEDVLELVERSQVSTSSCTLQAIFDDWKPVIIKLSNKEPELLLALLKVVLEMIGTQEAVKYNFGGEHLTSEYRVEYLKFEQLSYLFEWFVGILKELKPIRHKGSAAKTGGSSTELNLPKETLVEFLNKCLLVSSAGNRQLMASALVLARMTGNSSLVEKLNKLALLYSSDLDFTEENLSLVSSESFLSQQEDSVCQVAQKLESLKLRLLKSNNVKKTDSDRENKSRWVVTKSWNPCPIGLLPSALGSSAHLPVLDFDDDHEEVRKLSESKEHGELNQGSGKRDADCDIEVLDNSSVKKARASEGVFESNDEDGTLWEGVKGQLMIGGVWKKVREEEVLAIASAVRILV